MQSVDVSGLDELDARFGTILREMPNARRELHGRIGERLKTELVGQMDASGLGAGGQERKWHSSAGSVRSWQKSFVGSGGGYVAVRPEDSSTGASSPGAITDYLESGHPVRLLTGKAKRPQKSRRKVASVRGYHFYQAARAQAKAIAVEEATAFADSLANKLEG